MASFFAKQKFKSAANTTGALLPRARVYRRVRGTRGVAGGKASAALALAVAKRALQETRKLNAERELKMAEYTLVNYDCGTDATGQWPGATGAVVGNGGAVFPLHYIAQGTSDLTRVGEQIVAKQIEIRGHLGNGYPYASGALRMIVFRDKQTIPFSGQPIPGNVLQVTRTNSLMLWDNIDRYEVYADETYNWEEVQISGSHATRVPFQFKKKINVPIHFSQGTANSVEKNGLYVMFILDVFPGGVGVDTTVIVGPGERTLMDVTARLTFTDA